MCRTDGVESFLIFLWLVRKDDERRRVLYRRLSENVAITRRILRLSEVVGVGMEAVYGRGKHVRVVVD